MKLCRKYLKINATRIVAGLCLALALNSPSNAEINWVHIPPVTQKTLMWCWAAVSEMVLDHYQFSNHNTDESYQCSIVESLGGTCYLGCEHCVEGIATLYHLSTVIWDYQKISVAKSANNHSRRFQVIPKKQRLSPKNIVREIDDYDPIIAAISPSGMGYFYPPGMGEHVVLIVGYDNSNSNFAILINDPMPFEVVGYDPYLEMGGTKTKRGQYWINYNTFVRNMIYKDSIVFEKNNAKRY